MRESMYIDEEFEDVRGEVVADLVQGYEDGITSTN